MDVLASRINDAVQLKGRFRLRSGAVSDTYFDKYAFEADPALLEEVCSRLQTMLPSSFDALAGLELGGVPIATLLAHKTGRPVRFVRKSAKPYGTQRLAEGGPVDALDLVVVEDVVTSGGQIIESTNKLRELGAKVEVAVCVIDREAGGAEALAREGVELRSLFRASDLIGA